MTKKALAQDISLDAFTHIIEGLSTLHGSGSRLLADRDIEIVPQEEAELYLRTSKTAQKVCGKWAEEMFREGFRVEIPGDPEQQRKVTARIDELDAAKHFQTAATYREAFGGGAVLFHLEESDNPSWEKPLEFKTLQRFTGLSTLTPKEARVVDWDIKGGAKNPRYGMPLIYEVRKEGDAFISDPERVHYSRMAIFQGYRPANRVAQTEFQGWGDSVFTAIASVLEDFEVSSSAMAKLLQKFTILVMKVEGLAQMAGQNSERTKKRIAQLNAGLSILKMFILDAKEDVKRETVNLTGAADVMDRLAGKIAMVADLPKSILLGESETGLNNDGSSTVRFFYDRVKSKQKGVKPALNTFVKALFSCTEELSGGGEPPDWTVVFNSLWQPTQQEEAEIYSKNTEADARNIEMGVVHPEEIRESRFGANAGSGKITIDPKLAKDLEAMRAQALVDGEEPAEDEVEEAEPPEGGITPPPAGESKLQDRVLNGGQLTALKDIVTAVANEEMPRESGIAMIKAGYQLSDEDAKAIMANAGDGFEPKEDPLPVVVAPGAKPNGATNKTASSAPARKPKAAGAAKRKTAP